MCYNNFMPFRQIKAIYDLQNIAENPFYSEKQFEKRLHMKILVVGMGLIGGSFCKAIKKYTAHHMIGHGLR